MELTWTVPVALILASTIYLTAARYFRSKERVALVVAIADPSTVVALGARMDALEAAQTVGKPFIRE